jgi:hypothetical protein
VNPALLIAEAQYHAKHGDWPVARDLQLSRPAPDADENARATRNTFRLVRAVMAS